MITTPNPARTSADEAIARFDTADAAAKYSTALNHTATHKREMACILNALKNVPNGARVLDLPSGTGRLFPELTARGFEVTEADSSPHMVDLARDYARQSGLEVKPERFVVASVLDTGFTDGAFDAVVCNRLFHHFREADVRRKALVELKRICRGGGPIIASFFCTQSFDGVMFHLKQAVKRDKDKDRIPISRGVFARDVHAAGLHVRQWIAIRPGISKQVYAVLENA